jgi:catechol 2,3-dioxygenase-like lactoylglutathione lyase family enzyme
VIHHAGVDVTDLDRSGRFYDALLGPLGWRRLVDDDGRVGWGIYRSVFFASANGTAVRGGSSHVCFSANAIPAVKAAYEGGLEAGGTDDGAPGPRPGYRPGYYAAYLRDPDGHRVEIAVSND